MDFHVYLNKYVVSMLYCIFHLFWLHVYKCIVLCLELSLLLLCREKLLFLNVTIITTARCYLCSNTVVSTLHKQTTTKKKTVQR